MSEYVAKRNAKKTFHTGVYFLLFALQFLLVKDVFAQTESKIYYNDDWQRIASKEGASYYRLLQYNINSVLVVPVKDYYITGEVLGEGFPLEFDDDGDIKSWKGKYKAYFKSGKQQYEYNYNDSGELDGQFLSWYENGVLSSEINYKSNTLDGIYKDYHPNGKLKTEGIFESGMIKGNWYKECDEFGDCKRVIYDNLTTKHNPLGWKLVGSNFASYKIDEELGLICDLTSVEAQSELIYMPINQQTNFTLETSFYMTELKEEMGYGLVWGYKDMDNFQYFYISTIGEFSIGSVYEGLRLKGKDWEKSTFINSTNKTVNSLKISKYGDKIYYSINGEIVFSETFNSFKGNYLGFSVRATPSGKIGIGGFKITEDIAAGETAKNDGIKSTGTCFLIDSTGYALTNYHVIEEAKEISVDLLIDNNKVTYPAELVVVDKANDLALMKIKGDIFPLKTRLQFNFLTDITDVGTEVFTLGYPQPFGLMGEEVKFTDGKVSSKTGFNNDIRTYQITVPIQLGNSGGPLFDFDGNLLGVIVSKITSGDNVSYALKSNLVKNLIDVAPQKIVLPNDVSLANKSLTQKIKTYSNYVGLVKVK